MQIKVLRSKNCIKKKKDYEKSKCEIIDFKDFYYTHFIIYL